MMTKKKKYNTVTGSKVAHKRVDQDTDRVARAFIDSCFHLTRVEEARMDNLLNDIGEPGHANLARDVNLPPEPEVDDLRDWMDTVRPTAAELTEIELES